MRTIDTAKHRDHGREALIRWRVAELETLAARTACAFWGDGGRTIDDPELRAEAAELRRRD